MADLYRHELETADTGYESLRLLRQCSNRRTGWHHHMTMVLLAMLFHLILQQKWKDKAPMLTIRDVRAILEVIVPKRIITKQGILELINEKHKTRESARRSHHKKNSKA